MRRLMNAEVLEHSMKLQQMGGKIEVINSKLCYVSFDVGGFELQYVYNINKKGNYFLERIKPYPLPLKEFEKEDDVVKIIGIDVDQFRNAIRSHNANDFVDTGRLLTSVLKQFEDLYLYYNVPKEDIDEMTEEIKLFRKKIFATKEKAKRLYFDKEPDNL